MVDANEIMADFRAELASIWPETAIAAAGIYEAEHLEAVPFDQLTPPYAVLLFPELERAPWALDSEDYEADVELYYVIKSMGTAAALRTKLRLMQQRLHTLETTGLTNCQILETRTGEWGRSVPINDQLRAKKLPIMVGRVSCRILTGEILGL